MARIGGHATAQAARAALVELVAAGGTHAAADPGLGDRLVEGCAEESAETRRWIRILAEVGSLGVTVDLTDSARRDGALARICAHSGLSSDAARWAIEAWAEALGVEPPHEPPGTPPPPRVRAPGATTGRRPEPPPVPETNRALRGGFARSARPHP